MTTPAPITSARDAADNDDRESRGRGDFFAVDQQAFDRVCDLKSVNAAVAYLVMARGTGGDNRTTSWSVNAIEQRTGISRPRAKAAVDLLIKNHLADKAGGSAKRPRYKLRSVGPLEDGKPDWTWLPNAVVDPGEGKGLGALSPVERLRRAQEIAPFRLLVRLYNSQSLANDGGIDWRQGGIRVLYKREPYGRVGALCIWGFSSDEQNVTTTASFAKPYRRPDGSFDRSFWDHLSILKITGLLEFVPHLMDSDSQEAEILHPIPPYGVGEDWEQQILFDAERAVRNMLAPELLARVDTACPEIIVPVPITSPKVTVVGIARLRYRARTAATAQWFSDMRERCEEACTRYEAYARGQQRASAA